MADTAEDGHCAHQSRHRGGGAPAAVTLYVTQSVGGNGAARESRVQGELPDLTAVLERLDALEARPQQVARATVPAVPVQPLVDKAVAAAEERLRAELTAQLAEALNALRADVEGRLTAAERQSVVLHEAAPVAPRSWALSELLAKTDAPEYAQEAETAPPPAPEPELTPEQKLDAVRGKIEEAALAALSRLCSDQIAWEAAMRARNGSSQALRLFEGEAGVLGIDPAALVERVIAKRQANERRTMAVRAAYLRAWQAQTAEEAESGLQEMMGAADG